MKDIEKHLLNIKCVGFPDKCNKESCKEFICDEIKNQYVLELIKQKKDDPYFLSDVINWLELDTWTPNEALLLLSNINPHGAMIEWGGYKNSLGIYIDKVKIINVIPLDKSYYIVPFKHKDSERFKKVGEEEIKKNFAKLKSYEGQLNRIKKLWDSGQHTKERYPIKYYLDWANKKQITIQWYEWAKINGLLDQHHKLSRQLGPRAETTYLNIIGALLEFVKGEAPDIKKHPNFISEAKLIEIFSNYEIPGLSKPTLEKKFAAAKKSFKGNM